MSPALTLLPGAGFGVLGAVPHEMFVGSWEGLKGRVGRELPPLCYHREMITP